MIKTENLTINGEAFIRTYSDSGHYVVRNGVEYSEAIDPVEFGRQYTEGNAMDMAVTETDYQNALREMGVQV